MNLARVKQAKLNTAASIQELKGFTETIITNTEIAYWQYVLAKQKIAIFEQSLAIGKVMSTHALKKELDSDEKELLNYI